MTAPTPQQSHFDKSLICRLHLSYLGVNRRANMPAMTQAHLSLKLLAFCYVICLPMTTAGEPE